MTARLVSDRELPVFTFQIIDDDKRRAHVVNIGAARILPGAERYYVAGSLHVVSVPIFFAAINDDLYTVFVPNFTAFYRVAPGGRLIDRVFYRLNE